MKIFYSKSLDAFYPDAYMLSYKSAGNWPKDLVEVSKEDFEVFGLATPPNGKVRAFTENTFSWVDANISLTPEQIKESELVWVRAEFERVRLELEKVQDSDPKAIGTVAQWREYRKLLRAWPENSNFPSLDFRPKAPDYKE